MKKQLIVLLLVIGQAGQAQQVGLETLLSAAFPSNLTADPKGDRFAWVFNEEGKRNVWLAQSGQEASKLTTCEQDDGQEIGALQFVPGKEALIFERGGAPNRSGELPNPQSFVEGVERAIYYFDLEGDSARLLVKGSDPVLRPGGAGFVYRSKGHLNYFDLSTHASATWVKARGSLGSMRWSPDGEKLAFVSRRADHSFVGVFVPGEKQVRWLAPSLDQDGEPVWSPDGRKLAFLRQPHETGGLPFQPQREGLPWSIVIYDLEKEQAKLRWTAPEGPGSAFRTISAEQQLFWTATGHLVFPWEGDGWTHLYALPEEEGDSVCLTPGTFEVQFVSLSPDGRTLLYSSNQDDIDRQHVWSVIPGEAPAKLLSPGKGVEWSPTMNGGGTTAMLHSTGVLPAHPVYLDNGTLRPLAPGTLSESWPADHLKAPEQVVFPAADGMRIRGQLFLPADYDPSREYPAVLFFHGGSRRQMLLGFHHRGYYHNAFSLNHYLAQQGYIVLAVNYRSGIGYGLNFREALNYGATGASEFNDVLGAGLYLQQRPDVADDRIGLWGGSYGGYLTALGLARASDLFAAGVDIHGVHDWNKVIANFRPDYREVEHPEFARMAYAASPMNDLDTWRSPVLIIHGDDDRNVPFSESVDLAEGLRKRGLYFEQLVFPDEVHGFLLHRNWLSAYRATADFFDRMLK